MAEFAGHVPCQPSSPRKKEHDMDIKPPGTRFTPAAWPVFMLLLLAAVVLGAMQFQVQGTLGKDKFLLLDALVAIVGLIALITQLRVHPFIALTLAAGFLGLTSGMPVAL